MGPGGNRGQAKPENERLVQTQMGQFYFLFSFFNTIWFIWLWIKIIMKLAFLSRRSTLFIHLKTVLVLACGKHRLKLKNTCTEAIRNIDKDSFEQNLVVKEKNNILNIWYPKICAFCKHSSMW